MCTCSHYKHNDITTFLCRYAAIVNQSLEPITEYFIVLFTDTFFVEFKTEALRWNDDFTEEYHDTYIKTANMIVEIVSGENFPCQNGYSKNPRVRTYIFWS